MIIQDLNEKQKRSIQIPESADPDAYRTNFPYPKEGNVIVWRGGKLVNEDYQNALSKPSDWKSEFLIDEQFLLTNQPKLYSVLLF